MLGKLKALASFALSDPKLTLRLLTWRRVRNAFAALFGQQGNMGQLVTRYEAIYRPDAGGETVTDWGLPTAAGDVFFFSVIDWDFRFQRPQHLALGLANQGYRVIYVCPTPLVAGGKRDYVVLKSPASGLFVVQISSGKFRLPDLHQSDITEQEARGFLHSLHSLFNDMGAKTASAIVEHPAWYPVVSCHSWHSLVYDCLDQHAGFGGSASDRLAAVERALVQRATCNVASSQALLNRLQEYGGDASEYMLIRNGCEFDRFAAVSRAQCSAMPVIGYVGAISEWFDFDLLLAVAQENPKWTFVLVGASVGAEEKKANLPSNVKFIGEIPYSDVPGMLSTFDVCVIPFILSPLTIATNPVKLYEYLAAGCPIVATPLPELAGLEALGVCCAENASGFAEAIEKLLPDARDAESVTRRREWAAQHGWSGRSTSLAQALEIGGGRRHLDGQDALESPKKN
ncbi:glycosyltransferase [Achromobacter aegrifaciens]|uniref:glycosyltransferase n=1 Tax=Achromobacter aegrifaciens TaxID=1287736 RepID=UPI00320A953B